MRFAVLVASTTILQASFVRGKHKPFILGSTRMKSTHRLGGAAAVLCLAIAGFTTSNAMEIKVNCDQNQDLLTAIRKAGEFNGRGALRSSRDPDTWLIVHMSGTCSLPNALTVRGRDGWDLFELVGDADHPAVLRPAVTTQSFDGLINFRDVERVVLANLSIRLPFGTGVRVARVPSALLYSVTVEPGGDAESLTGLIASEGSHVEVNYGSLHGISANDSEVSMYAGRLERLGPGQVVEAVRSSVFLYGMYLYHGEVSLRLADFSTARLQGGIVQSDGMAAIISNSSTLFIEGTPPIIDGAIRLAYRSFLGVESPETVITGRVDLWDFSNATLSHVVGNVECARGSDIVVQGDVQGIITNCPSQAAPAAPAGPLIPLEPR
jgi:hypothetical protein